MNKDIVDKAVEGFENTFFKYDPSDEYHTGAHFCGCDEGDIGDVTEDGVKKACDWLRTTLTEALKERDAEVRRVIEGMLKTNVYKLRKHSEPFSKGEITIPADYESAFRLGKEVTLKDLLSHLTEDKEPLSNKQQDV